MRARKAEIRRKTRETAVALKLNLDGAGRSRIDTSMAFLDHMLELFSKHSGIDITLRARGDIRVDQHHTVEDIGIVLGCAIKEALGRKEGVARFGFCTIPMDEALAAVALDLSGRPHLRYEVRTGKRRTGDFDIQLVEEFFRAMANSGGITLHVGLISGRNPHHIVEAVFKAVGVAMAMAVRRTGKGVPSTKGSL